MKSRLQIISIILLLLMTLQVLPIARIGRMLGSNQWTEELPHGQGDETGKADQVKFSSMLPPEQYHLSSHFMGALVLLRVHICQSIPCNHSTDVLSPPPDFNLTLF